MDLPSDLIDLLAEFADEKVEYLLVGGLALALHGLPRFTKDADLWIRDEPENLGRATRALEAFGAPRATVESLRSAAGLDVVWMGNPPARIDMMKVAFAGPASNLLLAFIAGTIFRFIGFTGLLHNNFLIIIRIQIL